MSAWWLLAAFVIGLLCGAASVRKLAETAIAYCDYVIAECEDVKRQLNDQPSAGQGGTLQ